MKLRFKFLNENAKLPQRATEQSAGYDLSSCEEITVRPHERAAIHTGLSCEIEGAPQCVLLIYARSSLAAKHGLTLANCVGVVDTDYRGEIIVPLINLSDECYTVTVGERIAQMVVTPILTPETELCSELSDTERGSGGFGSTGKN